MKSLKDKEYELNEVYVHRKTQNVYMSENVKEAVLKANKNNLEYATIIETIIEKHKKDFTDKELFDILTSLDGIKFKNKKEIFGDWEK